jgi:hypothetical protein
MSATFNNHTATNSRLVARSLQLIHNGLSTNTRKNYITAESSLAWFLRGMNVPITLPVSWENVVLWISRLSYSLRHATIRGYVSGIATLHRDNGIMSPTDHPVIHRILDGIAREQSLMNIKPRRSLPITPTLINMISSAINMNDYDNQMIITAMSTATAGLMRIGELTITDKPERTLLFKHVARVPNGYRITLPFSKTDQYGHQSTVLIGDTNTIKCIDTYINNNNKINNNNNNSNSRNNRSNDVFFTYMNGTALTRSSLINTVNKLLKDIHVPPHRGVSFRAGGATSLAANGVDTSVIKKLGRWRSNAVERYLRTNEDQLLLQSSRVSSSSSSSSSSSNNH